MGQKVSPTGLRIGVNKDWESKWMAPKKDVAKYLNNDIKIRKYLETNLKDAGISKIEIEKNNIVSKYIDEKNKLEKEVLELKNSLENSVKEKDHLEKDLNDKLKQQELQSL